MAVHLDNRYDLPDHGITCETMYTSISTVISTAVNVAHVLRVRVLLCIPALEAPPVERLPADHQDVLIGDRPGGEHRWLVWYDDGAAPLAGQLAAVDALRAAHALAADVAMTYRYGDDLPPARQANWSRHYRNTWRPRQ